MKHPVRVSLTEVTDKAAFQELSSVRVQQPFEEAIGRVSQTRAEVEYATLVFDGSFSVEVPRSVDLDQVKPGNLVSILITDDVKNPVRVKILESSKADPIP